MMQRVHGKAGAKSPSSALHDLSPPQSGARSHDGRDDELGKRCIQMPLCDAATTSGSPSRSRFADVIRQAGAFRVMRQEGAPRGHDGPGYRQQFTQHRPPPETTE